MPKLLVPTISERLAQTLCINYVSRMNTILLILPMIAVLAATPSLSSAWGPEGHEIVGVVAQHHLRSSHAKQKILEILGDETLKEASTWPDAVKHRHNPRNLPEALRDDQDSIDFVIAAAPGKPNADNERWHFANLPLGAPDYQSVFSSYPELPSPDNPFTSPRDIVHVINVCIQRLHGHSVSGYELSEKNALRFLVHLLGDIHQPLHIASGYFAASPASPSDLLIGDPKTIADGHLKGDRGGNSLFYQEQPAEELHAHWDGDLVKYAIRTAPHGVRHNVDDYAAYLATLKPESGWKPTGDITKWAEQVANESLANAKTAYAAVTPTDIKVHHYTVSTGHGSTPVDGYPIQLTTHYDADDAPMVQIQLAKAGYRLAK